MADGQIELSKDGIKFPYRRYLSDSSPGFIFILLSIALYHDGTVTIAGIPGRDFVPRLEAPELKAFVFLLLFLMATPTGVIFNVIGWVTLEWLQKRIEMYIFREKPYLMSFLNFIRFKKANGFKQEYGFEECIKKFHIKEDQWFERIRTLEIALIKDFPEKSEAIEALRGIAILLRNLALIAFCGAVCLCISRHKPSLIYLGSTLQGHGLVAFLLFFAFLFLVLSAIVSFYFHVQVLRNAHVLSDDEKATLLNKVKLDFYPYKHCT